MKWSRPSGTEIETNDEPATIAHCESVGWKRLDGGSQSSMTVAELKEALQEAGIDIPDGAKKADLQELLEGSE